MLQYVPAGQGEHDVALSVSEYSPKGQGKGDSNMVVGQWNPFPQGTQALRSAFMYVPASHIVGPKVLLQL